MMEIKSHEKLHDHTEKFKYFLDEKLSGNTSKLDFIDLTAGPSNDHSYSMPGHAMAAPLRVGKENLGQHINSGYADSMLKSGDYKDLKFRYKFNNETKKFDIEWLGPNQYHDSGFRDSYSLISAQALTPSSFAFAQNPFVEVLAYSNAREAAVVDTGTNPFAAAYNLGTIGFGGGFPELEGAGTFGSNKTFDVNATTGALTAPILNITGTYSLTLEEVARVQQGTTWEWGNLALDMKMKYCGWAMDMYENALWWFGNPAVNLNGIFTATPSGVTAYSGSSLNYISINNASNPGQVMYQQLASIISQFLTTQLNLPKTLKVFLSPFAYNTLTYSNYSSYDSTVALEIFVNKFMAGAGLDGKTPAIEFIQEPLFEPTLNGNVNPWNPNTYDYMAIVAPQVARGLDGNEQNVVFAAEPLNKYTYPAIPGTYQTQIKMTTRTAGIIAPYSAAIAVYSGFGIKSATT